MNRKFIFLFLALLLPGLIFVFLKRFGKNEFDIPVLYQQSADSLNTVCGTQYKSPFTLPDSVLEKINWKKREASVLDFNSAWIVNKELNRFYDSFTPGEYQFIRMDSSRQSMLLKRWSSCVFFVPSRKNLVLIDGKKRIRGYYDAASRDEIDRLILETKILLKKY